MGTTRARLTLAALAFMVGLPLSAFLFGPPAHAAAGGPPGSQLGGINTTATAAAVDVAPLTPGLVGAGNITKGDLIDVSVPYASSTASTGPTTTGLAAPAYPGGTAAGAGNALATFSPSMPAPLVNALNDHALAQSAYPPQVAVGGSSSYSPTGSSAGGIGTASSRSSDSATTSSAAVNNTSLLSGRALVDVTSSTVTTDATIAAASVATDARTTISGITIGGVVDIAGLSSVASANSDGANGKGTSSLKIGAVTVGGVPASIGPSGIQLDTKGVPLPLVALANSALKGLQQGGVSVTTLAPTAQQQGGAASVTSGALQIIASQALPSLQGHVPVKSAGVQLDLGLSQASAAATQIPAFPSLPSTGAVTAGGGSVGGTPAVAAIPGTAGTQGQTITVGTPGGGSAASAGPAIATAPSGGAASGTPAPSGLVPAAASVLGVPVKVAWILLAFVVSLIAAGPLLAFANWQLLRGRSA